MGKLHIITGPAGVGKSTISRKVAEGLTKSVLIEGDDIYNQFVGGRISPWKEGAPLEVFWDNCIALIRNYLENDYDVVFNYIVKKETLRYLKYQFKEYDMSFTCLLTDEGTIVKRDQERPEDCRMNERSLILLKEFIEEDYDKKHILDTSNLSIVDTVNEVMNNPRFNCDKLTIDEVKTPEDVLKFMEDNISYGWKDLAGKLHLREMNNFRSLYTTSSLEETLQNKMGTCVEQAVLIKYLLDKIGIKNKLYCSRFYEDETCIDVNKDVHMHCFVLYYLNGKVYQMEHPNYERVGIYEYPSEEVAIEAVKKYYEEKDKGKMRKITEFEEVPSNLTFKDLNIYVNNLDKEYSYKNMIKK